MRCLACGVEMKEVSVVADATVPVPGYAHHTFECPQCHDTETRLLFGREPHNPLAEQTDSEPAAAPAEAQAPDPEPPNTVEATRDVPAEQASEPEEHASALPSAWGRALAKLRQRLDRR